MIFPRFETFFDLLRAQAPERIAFEFEQGHVLSTWTYGELVQRMERFPLPDSRCIGVFASTTPESILTIFALAGRRRIVLLNPDDPIEKLRMQIRATHVDLLLGDEELAKEFEADLDHDHLWEENDILFFTSGTTSKAKAVVLTEESLCSAAYNGGSMLLLRPEDRFLSVLPLSHVFGFVCALLWPLSFGACVCLGRGLHNIFFDFGFFHPTVASLVPQMAAFLCAKNLLNEELYLVLIGAGDCDDSVLRALQEKGIRVSFGYGLTETSSGIALSLGMNPRAMSVCPDYRIEIASDGEILVHGGPTFMKGYYGDEINTRTVLSKGVLHTGDLGRLENGLLYLTGRKKEILVFNDGSKLFLPEFEADLREYLTPDADFAILQGKRGEVVLYIHKPVDVEKQVAAFNTHYPRSQQIARIVYADKPLPRTQTNKVQRYLIHIEEGANHES